MVSITETFQLFGAFFSLLQLGLAVSGTAYIGYRIGDGLSGYTRLDPGDLTAWKRSWRRLFDRVFTPVGDRVAGQSRSGTLNQVTFQIAVGLAATAVSIAGYFVLSGAVIGASAVVYASTGTFPEVSSVIELVAAASVLFGLATILYAGDRAAERQNS